MSRRGKLVLGLLVFAHVYAGQAQADEMFAENGGWVMTEAFQGEVLEQVVGEFKGADYRIDIGIHTSALEESGVLPEVVSDPIDMLYVDFSFEEEVALEVAEWLEIENLLLTIPLITGEALGFSSTQSMIEESERFQEEGNFLLDGTTHLASLAVETVPVPANRHRKEYCRELQTARTAIDKVVAQLMKTIADAEKRFQAAKAAWRKLERDRTRMGVDSTKLEAEIRVKWQIVERLTSHLRTLRNTLDSLKPERERLDDEILKHQCDAALSPKGEIRLPMGSTEDPFSSGAM